MSIDVKGKIIGTDEEGYLINRDDWNEDVAQVLALQQAEQDRVTLTEDHWGLMEYFRDYYKANKVHPTMHKIVESLGKHHGKHFHEHKEYEEFLYKLFPRGPVQELCRLAGLPKPIGDVE